MSRVALALHSADIAPTDPNVRHGRSIAVHHAGRDWQSWWNLCDDRSVHVWGAYGERKVAKDRVGRKNTEKLARELLAEIGRAFSFNPVPEIHQTKRKRR